MNKVLLVVFARAFLCGIVPGDHAAQCHLAKTWGPDQRQVEWLSCRLFYRNRRASSLWLLPWRLLQRLRFILESTRRTV
jgi:hypothetical protein